VIARAGVGGLYSNLTDALRANGRDGSVVVPLDHEIRKLVPKRSGEKKITAEHALHCRRPGLHVNKREQFSLEPIA